MENYGSAIEGCIFITSCVSLVSFVYKQEETSECVFHEKQGTPPRSSLRLFPSLVWYLLREVPSLVLRSGSEGRRRGVVVEPGPGRRREGPVERRPLG